MKALVSASARGHIAELRVEMRLTAAGYVVSRPAAYAPYDIVAEVPVTHKMLRIQVKLGRERGGKLFVNGKSDAGPYEEDAFDYFAVVFPWNDEVLFIPWAGDWRAGEKLVTEDMQTFTEMPT